MKIRNAIVTVQLIIDVICLLITPILLIHVNDLTEGYKTIFVVMSGWLAGSYGIPRIIAWRSRGYR